MARNNRSISKKRVRMIKKIKLSAYYFRKCEEFANKQLKTSYSLYKRRGEGSSNKMIQDIIVGKLGELAVYKFLKEKGYAVNRPDFKIYSSHNKSFSADLRSGSSHFHIKSQSTDSVIRYGHSWLLQRSDKLVSKPTLEDILIFTEVDLDSLTISILGCARAVDIKVNGLFEECVVPYFRETKVALYWNNLSKIGLKI